MSLSRGLVPLMVLFAAVVFIVWIAHIAGSVTRRRSLRLALTLCVPVVSFALFAGLTRTDYISRRRTHTIVGKWRARLVRACSTCSFMLTPMKRTAQSTDVRAFGDHFFLVTQIW